MDRLDQFRVFIQISEMGSFVKAARALDLPPSSVSSALQQLEESVGTRLLHRTTRRVQLTPDGSLFLERARRVLAEVDALDRTFHASRNDVTGRLKVDVPSRIARRWIAPALPQLFRRHPGLELVLSSTDRVINLVEEGIDCAIRVGTLVDSSLVARPLGRLVLVNCASAGYLREFGFPAQPNDLLDGHWAVGYASPASGREQPWECLVDGLVREIPVSSRVTVNNAESYIACCRAGLGLIQIPRFDVKHLLDSGELVEVMPSFRAAPMEISALYPHRRHRSRRLNAFVEWFGELIRPHLEP